jgi:S1-C subfamily serine protease
MVEALGLERPGGLVISQVHPQSAFARAGVQPGDVITSVDGLPVNTPAEMLFRMSVAGIGAASAITYIRDGAEGDVTLDLIAPPDTPPRAQIVTDRDTAIPGLTLSTVNPVVLSEYDLPLGASGVVVDDPGKVGARAGLKAGDVLRAIDGVTVTASATANDLLARASGMLSLDVQRGDQRAVLRFRL